MTRVLEEIAAGDSALVEQPPAHETEPGAREPLDQHLRWLWR
ncbi:hypothetical protein [Streptomyces sp. SID13031]|nr:hypothetical protein [Streptomyces sp. SID13031]